VANWSPTVNMQESADEHETTGNAAVGVDHCADLDHSSPSQPTTCTVGLEVCGFIPAATQNVSLAHDSDVESPSRYGIL
jgi:hypothetical protein